MGRWTGRKEGVRVCTKNKTGIIPTKGEGFKVAF